MESPENYIAPEGLRDAVNVALALGQPLLVTGEPGTGKTQLAASIAHELKLPGPFAFYTKTTSLATDLFYQYDALRRFQDVQLGGREKGTDPGEYITYQALGISILLSLLPDEADSHLPEELRGKGPARSVVLIDEIDKAPRDLPNDVLNEIEKMEFTVKETGSAFRADRTYRPVLVLTSNSEKNLPDAFLRRCVFYHIVFPSGDQLKQIVRKRFSCRPGITPEFTPDFIDAAVGHFEGIRKMDLKKRPATAEFLAWISILKSLGADKGSLKDHEKALGLSYSVLAKNREDLELLEKKSRVG
ncbi:MAG: MoxR family ATPase [Desulfobacteraceae bacterium]|nr:MoxR family ATPase [Desulfobacteraceae bacterium]